MFNSKGANVVENNLSSSGSGSNEEMPKAKVWSPTVLLVFALLFSFIPSAIMFSMNYGRYGYKKKKNLYLILSILVGAIFLMLLYFIPDSIAKALSYGVNVGIAAFMYKDQKQLYEKHISLGGKKASLVIPLVVCMILTGIILALSIFGLLMTKNIPDKKLTYSGNELYYTKNITEQEANEFSEYLKESGFFQPTVRNVSVKIDKSKDVYQFSIIVKKEYLNDEETISDMKGFAKEISENVFQGKKVEIHFTNEYFKTIKIVKPD